MVKEPTFEDQWPFLVKLRCDKKDYTEAFAWLHRHMFQNQLNYQTVFTTFGNRHVGFSADYKRLAILFKLKYG